MYLSRLAVTDFRSWPSADLELGPGVTVLVGRNGTGKTNLVEAVGYLATFGSHRVATDAPLVRRGCARAVVRGLAVRDGRELSVEVEITPGKANRARVNRAPVPRARDALGIVRSVLFAPEDLALVRGDPGERRRFLDELLVARWPRYAGVRSDYERVLRQRSALLKTARAARFGGSRSGSRARVPAGDPNMGTTEDGTDSALSTLEVWDGHLARQGSRLLAGRLRLVSELVGPARAAYAEVAPESEPVDLRYRPSVPLGEPGDDPDFAREPDEAELEKSMLAQLGEVRRQELERGVCLVGPHRDDLELMLGDGPAKGYASHGESWSLALALRLGSFDVLRGDLAGQGSDPVLILDDVFAELDSRRRRALAERAERAEQVLITAAVADDVPEQLRGVRFDIGSGQVNGPDLA
ncbi:MAG TPA: DNA replication/repair protein RecF [Pseudonocardia sp.]|nr:DNA replication/repair protein RecF [Pseudonocardia sp.]